MDTMEDLFPIDFEIPLDQTNDIITYLRSRETSTRKTIDHLSTLLISFPDLIECHRDDSGGYCLAYYRSELVMQILIKYPTLEMRAFERGLKHLGFKVEQTTHSNSHPQKIFKLAPNFIRKRYVGSKRPRVGASSYDGDFEPHN